jgi:DNA/RNA endonuclease G (NUC1)
MFSPYLRKACITTGAVLGAVFAATSPFTGRPLHTIPTPFATAFAKKSKANPPPPADPNYNPIDQFVVPLANPIASHQVKLFPGATTPAKFKPPVPTLSSGLTLEEQAAILEEMLPYGLPSLENIIVRKPYSLSYNFRTKNANWVAEHHYRENMPSEREAKRDEAQFMRDVSIPLIFSQSSGDYLKSGYSRGHLAPAASHSLTQDDMQQTFSFTNIIPQNQIMNETDWLQLEKFVRHLPKHFGNVRVLSGPMYIPTDSSEFTSIVTPVIGSNEVHVPSHLFKVIYLQGKDVISHCHMHSYSGQGNSKQITATGSACILTPSILKNSIRFSFPGLVYSPHYKKMFDYITQLPDSSEVKAYLLQSFDWRTRIKHLFTVGENPNQLDEVVVMAFIMKNDKASHGKGLETYMVKLPYVETLTGLCLTPRQDCDSITMGTWNP